jgi:CheY-like chemotaxis protein
MQAAHGPRTSAEASSPLVLIVDDYGDARELLSELLSFRGFRVVGASTGQEALDLAEELVPDVVVMDLSLPDMDGRDVTRSLKGRASTAHIPVIALTAHPAASRAASAREAGCDAFVTKPCRPDQLVESLRTVLQR